MNLIEDIVSDGHGPLDPSYVVIHETANPGATAKNHRDYWSRDDTYAVHYVGDWTGDCYYCVPEDRLCWQVGKGNPYVIGIELCHATNQEDFDAVWDLGVEWAAWQLSKRGWDVDRLLSHYDCTIRWGGSDHTDPIDYFERYGRSWEEFVVDVAYELNNPDHGKETEKVQYVYNGGGDVHRLYNPNSGFHHYTLSSAEKDGLVEAGWNYEGVAWKAQKSAEIPVYRMYNPGNGDHFYTQDYFTCVDLQEEGWKPEGVPFFTNRDGAPVFRLYNPNSGEHFYTAIESESDNLRSEGWDYEGVAFNAEKE